VTPDRQRLEAARDRMRANPATRLVWRVVVAVTGGAVVLAGVAMIILPGPGWLTIFVGLAILATEFAWAAAVLHRAREYASRAATVAKDPARRTRNLVIAGVVGLLVAAGFVWYVAVYGWSLAGPRAWL
jgi:uncharacterized protein (TIGR02611 family)